MKPEPIPPGPGQESVWDYPRPPRIESMEKRLSVVFNGQLVAETRHGLRVLETANAPVYYFPPEDVVQSCLRSTYRRSFCEWKGMAAYLDVMVNGRIAAVAAWVYPDPTPGFTALKDYFAFYAGKMDACFVGDEQVRPQPGQFYGGWITDDIVGPIKGAPGSEHW